MRIVVLTLMLCGMSQADAPKNVVFLIADDLGLQLGCYGDKAAKTPNIDALAAKGTRFTHAFASVASCSPSRSTMLTGQPTHQNGMYGLAHADHHFQSFAKTKSLPGILNPAGYQTAVFAKLHVGPKEVYPFTKEFPAGGGRNGEPIAKAVKGFIDDCGGKPFFLHIGFTDPHRAAKGFGNKEKSTFDPKTLPLPYHISDTPDARADLAEYYESVARLDANVGLVMKALGDHAKDTLIFFFSDNGIPFSGAKCTLYDAGVRLPLIVVKPGQQPGVVNDMLVSWTDLAPTVLDWAGLSKPDNMFGRSFLSHIDHEPAEGWNEVYGSHQFHEITMYYPMRMVRTGKYKLIHNLANALEFPVASDLWGGPTWQGVLSRKDTMMGSRAVKDFQHRPEYELFDLEADPNELKNVAEARGYQTARVQLAKKLHDWREKTNDPWLIKDKHE